MKISYSKEVGCQVSGNVVEKVVNNELDMTAGLISGVKNFAVTKGVDIFQAIIIFSIGYMICCWLRGVVRRLLARSNVEPSAISFISGNYIFLMSCRSYYYGAVSSRGGSGNVGGCFWRDWSCYRIGA